MKKMKRIAAITAALLICTGVMGYMPAETLKFGDFTAVATGDIVAESVEINETNFPDEIFRQYVADNFDTDGDGVLSAGEIEKATRIVLQASGISNMKGIEYFSEIEYLYLSYNNLTSLDLSKNKKLISLFCEYNQLTELNVSNNLLLEGLYCSNNQLTELDVHNNTALIEIDCYSNSLQNLDLSTNIALKYLECMHNQLISLDISNNTELNQLHCYNNQIKILDVSKNKTLLTLRCNENQITVLDTSNNVSLEEVYCNNNKLTSLNLNNNTALISFFCYDNKYEIALTNGKFDLSTLPTGFDITKASEWTNGTVEGNILTFEDASKNVTYTYDCGNEKTATFTLIPTDEPITPPTDEPTLPLGDINGDSTVDASDASNVLAVYALVSTGKESELTEEQIAAADVNKDGTIDASDASLILAYYAHISTGGTGTLEEYLLDVRN